MKHVAGVIGAAGLAALAGCASGGAVVQYGGVQRAVALPAVTSPCATAGIRLVSEGDMTIPREAMPALHSTASVRTLDQVTIVYDVTSDGRAANIRYGGNSEDFSSPARRRLVAAMADQVATFEYAWEGQASHAIGCRYALERNVS